MSMSVYEQANQVAEAIKAKCDRKPKLCLVLGSGLGTLVDELEDKVVIPYDEIPGFPTSSVHGHAGNLVFGRLDGKDLLVLQGRVHFYESGDMQRITLPARIVRLLGCELYFVTNAAGAVNREMAPGDLMLITDHINMMMGGGPLIGPNDERFGPRFPDMSEAYNKELRASVKAAAEELGIDLKEGVYMAFHGPEYETPAEIRMAAVLGADAVGMSTVPEVVVANHMGMRCVGISCISNMAAGILEQKLSHEEVMEVGRQVAADFVKLVRKSVSRILV